MKYDGFVELVDPQRPRFVPVSGQTDQFAGSLNREHTTSIRRANLEGKVTHRDLSQTLALFIRNLYL
jgi:hypothetical protein